MLGFSFISPGVKNILFMSLILDNTNFSQKMYLVSTMSKALCTVFTT